VDRVKRIFSIALILLSIRDPSVLAAQSPTASLDHATASAEKSLREGSLETADAQYRQALFEGWLLVGTIERIERRFEAAARAFDAATSTVAANDRAVQARALVHLQVGELAEAEKLLRRLVESDPEDIDTRRLLAQALIAGARHEEAVKELEAARRLAPDDLELAFALGRAWLGVPNAEAAAAVFSDLARARPIPQTHVLIGRTYRDFGQYERARAELGAALKLDPLARRAHYELGMAAVKEGGRGRLEEAIAEFRLELKNAPEDPQASLELGVALVENQDPVRALPALAKAAEALPPEPRALAYLGRAQVGSGQPEEGTASLRKALELARVGGANAPALRAIELQLGQALRELGRQEEAAAHFAEAQRLSAEGATAEREQMARYLDEARDSEAAGTRVVPLVEASPLSELPARERDELRDRVKSVLVRSYLNLGIMQAQQQRFDAAAELLEKAAELDADFPQVQSALGIAYFNARRYEKATAPLSRALEKNPEDSSLRRTLAMAWLNSQSYVKAAALLENDPQRKSDASLQFAYGLALVRSERAAEAQAVFAELLARHGDSPELSVLLGQAHAQQGDIDNASAALYRALKLKPDVADAYATLGVIYLKQGRLPDAESALQNAIAQSPDDHKSRHNLALVLDQQGRSQDALLQLRTLLERQPDVADARYLLGKILLAQGDTPEALEQLRAAARLAPEDANIHYQLAQAYQKSGHRDLAQQHFDTFRKLKDQKREAAP
jgi:tetratricopeptide (TPR) repeat protein